MIRYIVSALCGVIISGLTAGLPMYARFVTMENTIDTLAKSVEKLANKVDSLTIEVTELQTTNNLLTTQVKEKLDEPANR